jgi:hypothetical protein
MDTEKVELSANATSYNIEIDVRDLEAKESLEDRYNRYSTEHGGTHDTGELSPDATEQ